MKFLKEFFYFQKSDRRVLIVALGVAVAAIAAVYLVGKGNSETSAAGNGLENDSISAESADAPKYYAVEGKQIELFPFDPNVADSTQLLRLGLQPWQVRNIYRYRAHGGVYSKPEDFARLYGLTQKEYRELEPYISISADYQPAALLVREKSVSKDSLLFPKKLKEGETIDLNLTDTAQLKRVPGIGSYYARRIVDYGRRLGGFVNIDQLDELEHFPTSAKQYFVIVAAEPKRMNLNELSVNALKQHPYLNYYQARAITDYRRKHGPIKSLDDLRLLPDFSPEQLLRLKPYVEF